MDDKKSRPLSLGGNGNSSKVSGPSTSTSIAVTATATTTNGENGHSSSSLPSAKSKPKREHRENRYFNSQCCNSGCEFTSKEIVKAPSHTLFFFGVPESSMKKVHKVCIDCLAKAEKYVQDSIKAFKEGKPIYDIPFKPNFSSAPAVVNIDDDDSDPECGEDKEVLEVPEDLEKQVDAILASLPIKPQIKMCKESLTADLARLENEFGMLDKLLDVIDAEATAARMIFNSLVPPKYNIKSMGTIEFNEYGQIVAESRNPSPKRMKSAFKPGPKSKKFRQTSGPVDGDSEICVVEGENVGGTSVPARFKALLPTPGILPRPLPKVGDNVFVYHTEKVPKVESPITAWSPGHIVEVLNKPKVLEFRVKFQHSKSGRPLTNRQASRDTVTAVAMFNAKLVAYADPPIYTLPVGTRIISICKDNIVDCESGRNKFYAGIVAEPPKAQNMYRYLVFSDDGSCHYADIQDVRIMCEVTPKIWDITFPDAQPFIRSYLEKYPECPMVRLQEGSVITVEWQGKWWTCVVAKIDCSIVKLVFDSDDRHEWIYRGSSRLGPLYKMEMSKRISTPTHLSAARSSNKKIAIDYPANMPAESSLKEFEGKLQPLQILSTVEGPRPYVTHFCNSSCVRPFNESDLELRKISPLAYPIYLGFSRHESKDILYVAPCGRLLKTCAEVQDFLTVTQYNLTIDFFCFKFKVDCVSYFQPTAPILYQHPDISKGAEIVNVSCVNAIDSEPPARLIYTRTRLPHPSINLNLDDEFLTCCDCKDDCLDKDKCACWQLTLEGIKRNPTANHELEVGYQNRRLNDHITSGIFECNSRCQCRKTCSNRVVQFPFRWQLQIFKTANKGWGIRPLHDIPAGAFICIYACEILHDSVANEDGRKFGDEYLAEIDFIECMEIRKKGYEKEAHKLSSEDDDSDSNSSSEGPVDIGNISLPSGRVVCRKFCAPRPKKVKSKKKKPKKPKRWPDTRQLFGPNELVYSMDAKNIGNIGRYLNHSCTPNTFVQNVFVDTHDLRFPWIAFFTNKNIRAGTELTWDYNYNVGSVPGKTLFCYCGTPDCRGRLL